jgi:glycosyltransferase involved in cell wall biosynthesis
LDQKLRQIRIAIFDHSPDIGGAESSLLTFLEKMDRSRFKVKVILPLEGSFSRELRKINIHVKILHLPLNLLRFKRKSELKSFLFLPFYFFSLSFFLFRLGSYLKKNRFHLILTNTMKAHFYGSLAAWFCSTPVIWRFHDLLSVADFSPWGIKSVLFFGKHFPKKILAVSSLTKDYLIKQGLKQDKIEVIYSGIDQELLEIKNVSKNIKDELKLENQSKLIGCIGRIIPQKGQHVLLQAIPGVIEKYPEAFFLIIGDLFLQEEAYKKELLEVIHKNGIEKKVIFTGFRTDIGDVIQSLDIVVFPSTAPESFGLSILEAMALGKPVIATKVGGVCEMIEDRGNGILIEPNHPEQITEQIVQLLSHKEMVDRIGEKAKETVMKKFSLMNYIGEMEKAFDFMALKEVHS